MRLIRRKSAPPNDWVQRGDYLSIPSVPRLLRLRKIQHPRHTQFRVAKNGISAATTKSYEIHGSWPVLASPIDRSQ